MKKSIIILVSLILLSSCDKTKSEESSLKRQFKKHMQMVMNDSGSYEFVEIKMLLNVIENERKKKQDSLDRIALEYWCIGSKQYEIVKKGQQERKDKLIESGYLTEYDKAGIIKYRGANSFGAKILKESYFYVNDKNEIYEIDDRKVSISDIN